VKIFLTLIEFKWYGRPVGPTVAAYGLHQINWRLVFGLIAAVDSLPSWRRDGLVPVGTFLGVVEPPLRSCFADEQRKQQT